MLSMKVIEIHFSFPRMLAQLLQSLTLSYLLWPLYSLSSYFFSFSTVRILLRLWFRLPRLFLAFRSSSVTLLSFCLNLYVLHHGLSPTLRMIANRRMQLIFIFSTHVFDVGDLVMIDDQVKAPQSSTPSFMG